MSDVQTTERSQVPATFERAPLTAGYRPQPIVPTDIDQVWRLATLVSKSGMAPKDMQKTETITVAILHGLEIGLKPMMALQRIAVINGRPSIWGDAAIGLVRASGLCEYVQETISGSDDNMVAICRSKRKGEREPSERTFSVADAKRAGLWAKAGPWAQYPRRMLQMRARAFLLRDLYADVLGGLYIVEELEEPVAGRGGDDARLVQEVSHASSTPPAEQSASPEAPAAVATGAKASPSRKPLPPVVGRKAQEPQPEPAQLPLQDAPPLAPDEFRAWVVEQLAAVTNIAELDAVWQTHVQPRFAQMFPPDKDDLTGLYDRRRAMLVEDDHA